MTANNSTNNANKKMVLGKGMAALLGGAGNLNPPPVQNENLGKNISDNIENKAQFYSPLMLDITQIEINPSQPRKVFKEKEIEELALSIKENGIIQPLIVSFNEETKKFELIAGERRYRAAKFLNLDKVPVVVKKGSKKDKLAMAIIENVQRSDLNCIEEALAYFQLMEEFQLTQEEVAKKIGKERSTIANFLRLLRLPREVTVYLQKELLSFGHAKILAGLKEDAEILRVAQMAVAKNLSVRELEVLIKGKNFSATGEKNKQGEQHNFFNEKLDIYKQKLERKTGMQIEIKSRNNGQGQVILKFKNEAEFKDIYNYILNAAQGN